MSGGAKAWGIRLRSALSDAIISAWIAFFLFCLTLGVRTVDSVQGLTLKPRPELLAIAVGSVGPDFGRAGAGADSITRLKVFVAGVKDVTSFVADELRESPAEAAE